MHALPSSARHTARAGPHSQPHPHPIHLRHRRLPKRARTTLTTTTPTPAPQMLAAAASDTATTPTTATTSDLVSRVLTAVADTDGGVSITPQLRDEVDALLDELDSQHGRAQSPRPLDDPLLVGNYNVAYTSTSRAPSERGQPAGGRFRGRIGRALFRTTGVFQSVLPLPEGDDGAKDQQPQRPVALAVNKVSFRLFGLIPGYVGLRGRCYPCPRPSSSNDSDDNDDRSTVRVLFERPVLSLGPLTARIGPPSSVVLTTTYLDERVRLGRGSRGSLFVFTRGGAADEARMDEVGLEKPSAAAKFGLLLALAGMVAGGAFLWRAGAALAAVGVWLVAAGLAGVTYQGGIEREDEEVFGKGRGGGGDVAAKAAAAA